MAVARTFVVFSSLEMDFGDVLVAVAGEQSREGLGQGGGAGEGAEVAGSRAGSARRTCICMHACRQACGGREPAAHIELVEAQRADAVEKARALVSAQRRVGAPDRLEEAHLSE